MEKNLTANSQKGTFLYIFLLLVLVLMLLPFITTFNDLLTRLVMSIEGYRVIQQVVVPYEVKMIALVLQAVGFQTSATHSYVVIEGKDAPYLAEIVWNCIGWQSLVFFLLSGWVGLQGDSYTLISKIKTFFLGAIGTFLINILRIALVVVVAYYIGQRPSLIFHDYASTLLLIIWLLFFWWFSFRFVLERKYD